MIAVVGRHFGVFATLMAAFVFLPALAIGLVFPEVTAIKPGPLGTAPTLPPGFLPTVLALMVLQFTGLFAVIAIAADPQEGGGRSVGETLRATLPAMGRFLLALVVLWFGLVLVLVVLGIVGGLLLGVTGGSGDQAKAMTLGVGLAGMVFGIALWMGARMAPLPGVLLRETAGPVAAIRRAFALTRGVTAPLLLLTLVYLVVTLVCVLLAQGVAAAFGLVGTVAGGQRLGGLAGQIATSGFGAWLSIYYGAALGIIYRRLANA
jgi:hypothetical protein